jgi:small nuclear ribonucleoprotein (snRNP)-like protein
MSVSGKRGVGIPIILLHDAEGGIVTVELKNGYIYRGLLEEAQDNMNLTMKVSGQHAPAFCIIYAALANLSIAKKNSTFVKPVGIVI